MKKRTLSFFLCLAMVISLFVQAFPAAVAAEADGAVTILRDGEIVSALSLAREEKTTLTASLAGAGDCQWQILLSPESDRWVDIYDKTAPDCEVSYALVKTMLDDSGSTYLRCAVTGETTVYSDPVCVTILPGEQTGEEMAAAETSAPLAPAPLPAPVAEEGESAESVADFLAVAEVAAAALLSAGDTSTADEEVTLYTVTIQYLYSDKSKFNGQLVAQAYIAQVAAGTTLTGTVTSPNCVGYAPDTAEIDLSTLGVITEDKTLTVYYSPAEVSYTVRHYQQNVDDDEYTQVDTTLATGYTEAQTSDDAAKDYTGFTALSHYHEEIAADSSTTIDIYYDRNYYLMSFDLDGGYGVAAVYARYGASLSVSDPQKAGYSFNFWSLDGTTETNLPSTMPAENRKYTAVWSAGNATYTIAYWLENADADNKYDFVGSASATANSGDTVFGSDSAVANGVFTDDVLKYYSYNDDKTDGAVSVAGDGSTVVNVYYDRNEYTLKFYYARLEGTTYDIADNTNDSSADGGTAASASWVGNFTNKPTLDAKYTEQTETIDGNTYYYFTLTAKYGASLSELWPNAPLSSAGNYNFISWGTHYGSSYYNANSNKNIKGVYSILDSGLLIDPTITADQGVNHWMVGYWNTAPTMYTYEIYYTLLAGETAERTYNNADYKKVAEYTVGSTDVPSGQTSLSFEGVSPVGKDYDSNEKEDGNVIRFYYQRSENTVTLDDSYGNLKKYENIPYGDTLSVYLTGDLTPGYPDELPDGAYVFGGWYQSKEGIGALDASITMPNEDLIYYAKWVPVVYTVTINDGNGTVLSTEEVKYGFKATKPTDPVASDDSTFIGWYYVDANGEEQRFDFENMTITQDMTVYAKWRSNVMKQVTIRYVIKNQDGTETEVADSEIMMLRVGSTRTFEAKTGNSLYADYRTGTFPTTATTSVTPKAEDDKLTVVFCYKQYESVAYNVEFYVQLADGSLRAAFWTNGSGEVVFVGYNETPSEGSTAYKEAHPNNKNAIVTELYTPEDVVINGEADWALPDEYVPNALRIQRIIVPPVENDEDGYNDDNTIVFIYTYDPNAALYSVNHYIQSADGTDDYSLYSHKEYPGTIGATVFDGPISIPGYTYSGSVTEKKMQSGTTLNPDGSVMSGTVNKQDSLELNFYYTVNSYPYQIMYLEKGTNRVLLDATTKDASGDTLAGNYGAQVTYMLGTDEEKALLEDYEVDAESKSIYIQMEAGNTASINTIIFYYTRKSADLIVSKTVQLDAEQAAQTGIDTLPESAYTQEFEFNITYPKGFYKSVYDCIITDANGTQTKGTVIAQTTSLSFTLKHDETIQILDLDMGTYTITETYVPGFRITVDNNTDAQQREDVSITAELVNANENVTVNFVNSYPFFTGELVLGKTVTKADETNDPAATAPYKVTVTLTPADETREVDRVITWTDADNTARTVTIPKLKNDGTDTTTFIFEVLVPVDGTVMLSGAPAGDFTAEETVKGTVGYISDYYSVKTYSKQHNNEETATAIGSSVTGTIHGGHPTAVTFNNTYKKGDLTINKTVTQEYVNDNWVSDTFTFAITGTTELPAGTYYVTIGGENTTVTVDADGKVTVEDVTISVTKPEGTTDTSWTKSLTFENLPAGYYTVTEKESVGGMDKYTAVGPTESLLVNDTDKAMEASFTNIYNRTKGDLKVSKTIKLVGQGVEINTDQLFTFTVSLKDGTLTGEYGYTISPDGENDSAKLTVEDGKLTFTLKHGQSILINDLPVGEYEVTETQVEGYASYFGDATSANDTATVTVITGATTELTCRNDYPMDFGTLTVTKTVVTPEGYSESNTAPAGDEFTFTVKIRGYSEKINLSNGVSANFYESENTSPKIETLTVTNDTLTFKLQHGQSVDLTLPACTYTIAETDLSSSVNTNVLTDHYTTAYTVDGEEGTAGASYTLVSGGKETVVFTNTYKLHYADLTIDNTNSPDEADQVYVYEVKSKTTDLAITVTVVGNNQTTIHDLPVGEYTVTQQDDWSWRYSSNASSGVTVTLNGDKTLDVTQIVVKPNWLDGVSSLIKNVSKGG